MDARARVNGKDKGRDGLVRHHCHRDVGLGATELREEDPASLAEPTDDAGAFLS